MKVGEPTVRYQIEIFDKVIEKDWIFQISVFLYPQKSIPVSNKMHTKVYILQMFQLKLYKSLK